METTHICHSFTVQSQGRIQEFRNGGGGGGGGGGGIKNTTYDAMQVSHTRLVGF